MLKLEWGYAFFASGRRSWGMRVRRASPATRACSDRAEDKRHEIFQFFSAAEECIGSTWWYVVHEHIFRHPRRMSETQTHTHTDM